MVFRSNIPIKVVACKKCGETHSPHSFCGSLTAALQRVNREPPPILARRPVNPTEQG